MTRDEHAANVIVGEGPRPLVAALARLRELHAAPKNTMENYRYASRAQMDEFYAMHEAFPALAEIAEAALDFFKGTGVSLSDPRLQYIEVQCDQAKYERLGRAVAVLGA